jgi:putative NADH-flavin reductase
LTLRIVVLGASGALGSHVVRQALQAGHTVTAIVRNPAKLPATLSQGVLVHQADLTTATPQALSNALRGHDVLINTAGFVSDGDIFVGMIDRIVTAVEMLPADARPVCWFLAGAGLLDLDASGRRGLDLPKVKTTYWPHAKNYARLQRSALDWRLLCPGPMVESTPVGLGRLRVSTEQLAVKMPAITAHLPGWMALLLFAWRMPEMIVPYADAADLMLANLQPGQGMSHKRVALALPKGMRGSKNQWTAHKS